MTIALQNKISLQQFLSLPETKPANEYVDGQIYQKTMPKGKHSIIQRELTMAIDLALTSKNSASVFPELRCNFGGRSIVPDISVFITERIPRDPDGTVANDFNISPDWIIEILSPDQSPLRVMNKIGTAIINGSQLGWLISPAKELILVYTGDQFPESKKGTDLLPVLDVLSDWQVSVNDVFALLSLQ